jgi:hypothetical protein
MRCLLCNVSPVRGPGVICDSCVDTLGPRWEHLLAWLVDAADPAAADDAQALDELLDAARDALAHPIGARMKSACGSCRAGIASSASPRILLPLT